MLEQTAAAGNVDEPGDGKIVWKMFMFVMANRFSARDVWRRRCRRRVVALRNGVGGLVASPLHIGMCLL